MKNQILSLFLAAALLLPFVSVAAQRAPADDGAVKNSSGSQDVVQGQAIQAEVQTQTQNQGEDSMIMTQTREVEPIGNQNQGEDTAVGLQQGASNGQKGIHEPGTGRDDSGQLENGQTIGIGQQSQVKNAGESRRSQVANAVQAMLQVADRSGGIGEQIRVIAQNQNQNQQDMEEGLAKVQSKNKVMKFLFGPGYKQVRAVEQNMESCDEEIKKLKEIKNQLGNISDQGVIAEQIAIMEQAREELQAELDIQQKGFSLFGWLAKMLVK